MRAFLLVLYRNKPLHTWEWNTNNLSTLKDVTFPTTSVSPWKPFWKQIQVSCLRDCARNTICMSSIHKRGLEAARGKKATSSLSNGSLIFRQNFVSSGPKYLTYHLPQHWRLYESAHRAIRPIISFVSTFSVLVNTNKQNYWALLTLKSKHFFHKNRIISTIAVAAIRDSLAGEEVRIL